MYYNFYRETFKLSHRKATWLAPLLILFMMIAIGFAEGHTQSRLLMMTSFASSQVIQLVLVIVASSMFSMEFQNKAILTTMYKSPNKFQVFFSKVTIVFIYNIIIHLLTMLFSIVLTFTPIIRSISWLAKYQYNQTLYLNMINTNVIDLITSTFIISIIILISCMINSNAVATTANIMIIFMGSYVSYNLLLKNNSLGNVFKWNPLNMINLTQQYYNSTLATDTKLSLLQLIIASLLYTLLFFSLGYLIFKKKKF